jgi:hypothetical protein
MQSLTGEQKIGIPELPDFINGWLGFLKHILWSVSFIHGVIARDSMSAQDFHVR